MRPLAVPVLVAVLLAPAVALAGPNDFVLHRFRACEPGGAGACQAGIIRERAWDPTDPQPNEVYRVLPDSASFGAFAKELGIAISPRALEPAETLGQAGFAFGVATSVTDIHQEKEFWRLAMPTEGAAPPPVLTTIHLQLRKGLPFSFEMGGALTYLVGSEMLALGADVKWALNEGFRLLPDIAVRGSVNALVGNRDLDMVTGGVDATISNPFPIGGVVVVTPYAGWSRLLITAASHVLDATPGLDGFAAPHCNTRDDHAFRGSVTSEDCPADCTDKANCPNCTVHTEECVRAVEGLESADLRANFVLARQFMHFNRFFGGLRFQFTVVTLTFEGNYGDQIWSGSGKAELNF